MKYLPLSAAFARHFRCSAGWRRTTPGACSGGEWSRGRVHLPDADVLDEEDENGVAGVVITGEDFLSEAVDHIGDFARRLKGWRAYFTRRSRRPETLQERAS